MKLKRRELLVAAAAVATVEAQTQATPGDLLELAKRNLKGNREAMDKVKLPMAVEPAFSFRA